MEADTARWCRKCGQPVRLEGAAGEVEQFRKAVHAVTGREKGPDSHLAAPIGYPPQMPAAAVPAGTR